MLPVKDSTIGAAESQVAVPSVAKWNLISECPPYKTSKSVGSSQVKLIWPSLIFPVKPVGLAGAAENPTISC